MEEIEGRIFAQVGADVREALNLMVTEELEI